MWALIFLFSFCSTAYAQDVLCSKEFCEEYLTKNNCPKLPEACSIQNSTHNGIVLPYLAPCNCCDYCLENKDEGEDCAVGSPMTQVPNNICGFGLYCKESKCVPIVTPCTRAQLKYDEDRKNNALGHMELCPNCDRDGQYQPYHCIPGEICYCVDEDGKRIYGEIPFTDMAKVLLKCGCSRSLNRMSKFLGRPIQRHEFLRCKPDGNYDPIQCVDNKCICVDVKTGKPTNTKANPVTMNQISSKNLECFDKKTHLEFDYYRTCEDKHFKQIQGIKDVKEEYEVVVHVYPRCNPDGNYAPIQKSKTHKYCVNPDGEKIKEYMVELTSPEAKNMDCNCARASLLIEGPEKPVCNVNGNYCSRQCRRGFCRCVDANGNQVEKEVPEEKKEDLQCNAC